MGCQIRKQPRTLNPKTNGIKPQYVQIAYLIKIHLLWRLLIRSVLLFPLERQAITENLLKKDLIPNNISTRDTTLLLSCSKIICYWITEYLSSNPLIMKHGSGGYCVKSWNLVCATQILEYLRWENTERSDGSDVIMLKCSFNVLVVARLPSVRPSSTFLSITLKYWHQIL